MLNRFIFSIVNLDSASLTMLASVIHCFPEIGNYDGVVFRGADIVGRFQIKVVDNTLPETGDLTEPRKQVNIDLRALDLPVADQFESMVCNCFQVKTGGYVVFSVSTGPGGYAVEIKKTGSKCGSTKVFDSRKLGEQDLFAATVLRPGTYCITNAETKKCSELVVAYPEMGKIPKQPQPVLVECTPNEISPEKIAIKPTQPLLFSFKVPSRITIALTKPEDRLRTTEQQKTAEKPEKQTASKDRDKTPMRRLRINV
jgi:hypothetical protein